jgi:hypothetical protein
MKPNVLVLMLNRPALWTTVLNNCADLLFQTGALLRAAYEGDLERVSSLLREGVPVDSANSVSCPGLEWNSSGFPAVIRQAIE